MPSVHVVSLIGVRYEDSPKIHLLKTEMGTLHMRTIK
jgi:hypothetical protein